MKLLYWLVAAPLMILAIVFAVSNMGAVELSLWPLAERQLVPVFLVVFAAFAVGFFAGGLVAWIGGHRHRVRARAAAHRVSDQTHEIATLRRKLEETEAAAAKGNDAGSGQRALVAVDTR